MNKQASLGFSPCGSSLPCPALRQALPAAYSEYEETASGRLNKISRPCPLGKLRTSDLPRRKTCLGLGRVCRTQKPRSPQAYVPYVPYLPIQGSWGTQTKKARRPQAKKARAPQVPEADRGFWKRQQLDLGMLRFSGFARCLRTVEPAPFHLSHKPA